MKKNKCENCGVDFERMYVRRFCCKSCWHKWNGKNLASFNETRFQWKTATDEQRIERIKKRFEEKVVKKDGCWDWNGYFDKDGYTLLHSGANHKGFKERRGHRISWLIHYGNVPEGKKVCHKCDNPRCTNPEHLFLGTTLENNQDKTKKGRGNIGSKHGNSKLNEYQVMEIKKLINMGVCSTRIMSDYGISRMTVSSIRLNKTWKHVEV